MECMTQIKEFQWSGKQIHQGCAKCRLHASKSLFNPTSGFQRSLVHRCFSSRINLRVLLLIEGRVSLLRHAISRDPLS